MTNLTVMKNRIIILPFLTIILVLFLLLFLFNPIRCNDSYKKGKKNYHNSKKIHVGMNKKEVIAIMGLPDTIVSGSLYVFPNNFRIYEYSNRFGSSDDIHIVIDSNGITQNIFSSD
jgi:hypothetical protein